MNQRRKPKHGPPKIHAPYNFVPLSGFVYQPPWADQASCDVPFRDGLNGVLNIRIRAHSPLLIGGRQVAGTDEAAGHVYPYVLPDGTPAIPGTSLKGMIRNLMSIVSFGKMSQVDDRWLSVRDLTNAMKDVYRSRVTDKQARPPKPKARAGYLRPVVDKQGEFGWELTCCDYKRVEHGALIKLAQDNNAAKPEGWRHVDQPGRLCDAQKAPQKYERWGEANLEQRFGIIARDPRDRSRGMTKPHEKAQHLGRGKEVGRLVFTGQPTANDGTKDKAKHLEFIFYNPRRTLPVEEEVIRAFLHIHGETDEWKYWSKRLRKGLGVPVFYLERAGYPTEIGLALMFRLPYRHTIGAAVDQVSRDHRDPAVHDLAETVFGHINDEQRGLAGRVSFSTARQVGPRRDWKERVVVLSEPKPAYFPNYLQQNHNGKGLLEGDYRTLMDDEAEVRGWKRYPARPQPGGFPTADELDESYEIRRLSKKVQNWLHPLDEGAEFVGSIRIHNLRPLELGALVWCLGWGGDDGLRHGLGMGKPFGLGQVSITLDEQAWTLTRNDGEPVPSAKTCRTLFVAEMERAYRAALSSETAETQGWRQSVQMVQLTAMANPSRAYGRPGSLDTMGLDDFRDCRGRQENDPRKVLLPYAPFDGVPDAQCFPRTPGATWEQEHRDAAAEQNKPETEREAKPSTEPGTSDAVPAGDPITPGAELRREVWDALTAQESNAGFWLDEMERRPPPESRWIAEVLRAFYQKADKWEGRHISKKQKLKRHRIEQVLQAEEGDGVSQ